MKKVKGFSLAECVVAVLIVMLVGFSLVTTALVAISNTNKANAIQIINNESLNLVKIVKETSLEDNGEYSSTNLESALLKYYGKIFDLSEQKLNNKESVFIKDSGEIAPSGNIRLDLTFMKNNEYIALSLSGYYKDKLIKAESIIFEKYVATWDI